MGKLVGIRLKDSDKVYYYDSQDLELNILDRIVVEIENLQQIAWVTIASDQIVYSDVKGPLPPILRLATQKDLGSIDHDILSPSPQDQ